MYKNEAKKLLQKAVRQYRHNHGDGFVFGYDEEETEKIVSDLVRQIKVLSIEQCLHPKGIFQSDRGHTLCRLASKNKKVKPTPPRYDETYFKGLESIDWK